MPLTTGTNKRTRTKLTGPTPAVCALALLLACAAVYLFGLPGPFVLDDHANLAPIWRWLAGHSTLSEAVLGNASGPLSRPLAYLTFAANAAVGGDSALAFRLVNLLLHGVTGALGLWVVFRLCEPEPQVTLRAAWTKPALSPASALALLTISLWLLHPMQVSTVLYVVQRMAQLGAIAQLAAVACYLLGRQSLPHNPRRAAWLLFGAMPAAVALGLTGKESAALAPLLCLVIEASGLWDRAATHVDARSPRPTMIRWFCAFLLAGLALGTLLAAPALWERITTGYDGREFTLLERLLTQPRVLGDYLVAFIAPIPAHLALYRDGYPHSTSLLQPWTTAAWLAFWAGFVLLALMQRRRQPLVFIGMFWFLAGHALESTVLPLEPYFEHRNYLPILGLCLSTSVVLLGVASRWKAQTRWALVFAVPVVLAGLTAHRAAQWSDLDQLLANEGPPPGEVSRRLQVDLAIRGFAQGDPASIDRALAPLEQGAPGDRAAAALWHAVFSCERDGKVTSELARQLGESIPPVPTHSHLSWLQLLARRVAGGRCYGISPRQLVLLSRRWQDEAEKPMPARRLRTLESIRAQLLETVHP